jgi:hypothetical protein
MPGGIVLVTNLTPASGVRATLRNGSKFKGNSISTGKYNLVTFFPKGLYEQARGGMTPIGRRINKVTSLAHTYMADQWASFKATHNPTHHHSSPRYYCASTHQSMTPRIARVTNPTPVTLGVAATRAGRVW